MLRPVAWGLAALVLAAPGAFAQTPPATPATPAPAAPAPAAAPARPTLEADVEALLGRVLGDDPIAAEEAREEVLDLGRPAAAVVAKLLKDNGPQKRYIACELLGDLRDTSSVPALIAVLKDPDTYQASVASAAARTLGRLADAAAVPALIEALGSKDVDLRYEAARALGNLRAAAAAPKLLELLKDQGQTFHERLVCCGAAQALGRLGTREAVPELVRMLDNAMQEPHTSNGVNYYAARALERIVGQDQGSLTASAADLASAIKKWKVWWDAHKAEFGAAEKKADAPQPEPPQPEAPKPEAPK